MEAAAFLPPNVHIVLLGAADEELVQYRGRENISIVPHQRFELVPRFLKSADVLVLPNSGTHALSREHASPLKLFEYMAAGVPVVGLTYSDESKIRNLMRRLGQEERLFDVRNLEKQGFLTLIGDLLSGKQEIRGNLSEEMAALLPQIKRCNDQFVERFMRDAYRERAQGKRSPVRREDPKSENRYV